MPSSSIASASTPPTDDAIAKMEEGEELTEDDPIAKMEEGEELTEDDPIRISPTTGTPPSNDPEIVPDQESVPVTELTDGILMSTAGFASPSLSEAFLPKSTSASSTFWRSILAAWKRHLILITLICLSLYTILGLVMFAVFGDDFDGRTSSTVVDGLYFLTVTVCTVGYGDVVPMTTGAKGFTICAIILGVGMHLMVILCTIRICGCCSRIKVALCISLTCFTLLFFAGAAVLYSWEDFDRMSSIYTAVVSVTTIGYGDFGFKTIRGRVFAVPWLACSTVSLEMVVKYTIDWLFEEEIHDLATLERETRKSNYILEELIRMGEASQPVMELISQRFEVENGRSADTV